MITLFVRDVSTGDIFQLPFNNITITEELNVGSSVRVSLEFRAVDEIARYYGTDILFIFTGGLRELFVEKDSAKIYLGVITDFDISKDNTGKITFNVASVGFFSVLNKRRTANKRVFVNTDAGQIARTLIDESQTSDPPFSDLGITFGVIQPSVNRDRTYRFANIKQEITQMSNNNLKNGFDFEIDNNKVFNVFFPFKGSERPNIVLDEQNILSWGMRKPLVLSLTNKVYVVGAGFNDDVLFVTRNSPNEFKATFKLLEEVLSERQIITTETLDDKGDKFLSDNQSPILGLTITHLDGQPDILSYEVGDSLKFSIEELGIENIFKRVFRRIIKIDSNEAAIVAIDLK